MKIIKKWILGGRVSEPVVFRKIHSSWDPVTWSGDEWEKLLSRENKLLSVRCGKICSNTETQWESRCKKLDISWRYLSGWDEDAEIQISGISNKDWWLYYDYKYLQTCLSAQDLKTFNWSTLGFPERDGKDSTLWIGTRGAYTPCHFDTYGCNLVCQVLGRKRWTLFPPDDTKFLRPTRVPYEESSVYSQLNLDKPTLSDLEALSLCHPLEVILDPGDVLFVPSKWWHFVKSEEFSISVNSWIELPEDANTRLEEALLRTLTSCVVNTVSPDAVADLLNPNEADILDLTQPDLIDLLKNSYEQVLSLSEKLSEEESPLESMQLPRLPKVRRVVEPPSAVMTSPLEELQRLVPCLEKLSKKSFTPRSIAEHHSVSGSPPAILVHSIKHPQPTDQEAYLRHFINAIGHPRILKQISEQFMRNVSDT